MKPFAFFFIVGATLAFMATRRRTPEQYLRSLREAGL
jgi:hypothetical protein